MCGVCVSEASRHSERLPSCKEKRNGKGLKHEEEYRSKETEAYMNADSRKPFDKLHATQWREREDLCERDPVHIFRRQD